MASHLLVDRGQTDQALRGEIVIHAQIPQQHVIPIERGRALRALRCETRETPPKDPDAAFRQLRRCVEVAAELVREITEKR